MAVPRTHDGSVGPRSRSAPLFLPAVLAVVIVACLVVLGIRFAGTSGAFGDRVGEVFGGRSTAEKAAAAAARDRELAMSQATQFVLRLNSYGPSDLDEANKMPGYVESVREVITPKFAVDFEENVTFAEQAVAQAGVARTVEIYATGAETLGDANASVLVTGAIAQSYPDSNAEGRVEEEPLVFRIQVRLVKTEGRWLVDDFLAVEGPDDTQAESPPTGGAATSPVVADLVEIVANRRARIDPAVAELERCGFPAPAPAGDPACARAPRELGDAAQTLVVALQGATNPDSRVFVGEAPPPVDELVEATRAAAGNVVRSLSGVGSACLAADTRPCSDRRTTVSATLDSLVAALDTWESLS